MSVKTKWKDSERAIWTKARCGGQQWGEGECGQCLSVCMCVPVSGRGRGGSPVSELHSFSPTHWCVFQTGGYVKGNRILALSLSHTNTHTHTSVGSFLVLHGGSRVFSALFGHIWRAVCLSRWVGPRMPSLCTLFSFFLSSHVLFLLVLGCSFTFSGSFNFSLVS